jgi:hypothetical protein
MFADPQYKINWYRLSEAWYHFGPTITLYHGTNNKALEDISRNGILPVQVEKAVAEAVKQFGYDPMDVPTWIWQGELSYRKNVPEIHLTTLKSQAIAYAQGSHYGGEIGTSVTNNMIAWLKENGKQASVPPLSPVVLTVELPWEKIQEWNSLRENLVGAHDRMKEAIEAGHFRGSTLKEELESIAWQIKVSSPIEKRYIVSWEKV